MLKDAEIRCQNVHRQETTADIFGENILFLKHSLFSFFSFLQGSEYCLIVSEVHDYPEEKLLGSFYDRKDQTTALSIEITYKTVFASVYLFCI